MNRYFIVHLNIKVGGNLTRKGKKSAETSGGAQDGLKGIIHMRRFDYRLTISSGETKKRTTVNNGGTKDTLLAPFDDGTGDTSSALGECLKQRKLPNFLNFYQINPLRRYHQPALKIQLHNSRILRPSYWLRRGNQWGVHPGRTN
jgi:hypothetical protein